MHGTCLGLNRPQEHESGPMVQTTDVRDDVAMYASTIKSDSGKLRAMLENLDGANDVRKHNEGYIYIYIYTHTHTL